MKVVVTGGAGFIGSHLVEGLLERGYDVLVIDDLSTGKLENISHLLPRIHFVRGSILEFPLEALFEGAEFVFHLAAIPGVPRSIEDPLATHEVNGTGTLKVLLAARKCGVRKVVYASSSSVYGDTPVLPKREDMPPKPRSPYGVSKLTGEKYCEVFRAVYGLPTASVRYFNVYGPRQDAGSPYAAVIPSFIKRALSDEPPVIFGDGEQTRDFTFVRDAVMGTILAAESDGEGVFNIARGERISINKLACLILRLLGKNIKPVHEKPRPGDIRHSLADISRARAIGFEPEYGIEEGLKETICYYRGER